MKKDKIVVNTKFDAGSINVVDITNPKNLKFKIRNDTNSKFTQWFYFQLSNIKDQDLTINLLDLANTAYPEGWDGYDVCMSYDNENWQRLSSTFKNNTLTFKITPQANSIYFAYFEPYSYNRHQELVGYANLSPLVYHQILGSTIQGRNIDLLIVGNEEAKHKIWITARQHPGETMAEWFMEGLIHKLVDEEDGLGRTLLKNCVFYLVPNMNPDGAYLGNLRVNSAGANLNREWLTPTLEKSPEVYYVREKMISTGVDVFLDVHGDEAIPYLFTAGCELNPTFSAKQQKIAKLFTQVFLQVCPEYQTKYGYEKGHFKEEDKTMGTSWVGNKFDCLAYTLEMPFKDNRNLPDVQYGWNGNRSYLLGQTMLTVLFGVVPHLEK